VSANLDLVRSIFADWERGDWSSSEWADPQIELVMADGPEPGTRVGLGAMAAYWREFLRAWEGYRVRAHDYREISDEHVLVLLQAVGGRGKSSGVHLGRTVEQGANLFQISNGKVTRFVVYFRSDSALADLGLAPEGEAP
jgi:hypothetical protein